jgi:hypothetical protein
MLRHWHILFIRYFGKGSTYYTVYFTVAKHIIFLPSSMYNLSQVGGHLLWGFIEIRTMI